jgi:hypothetical protein
VRKLSPPPSPFLSLISFDDGCASERGFASVFRGVSLSSAALVSPVFAVFEFFSPTSKKKNLKTLNFLNSAAREGEEGSRPRVFIPFLRTKTTKHTQKWVALSEVAGK